MYAGHLSLGEDWLSESEGWMLVHSLLVHTENINVSQTLNKTYTFNLHTLNKSTFVI
jgi:hypothetical protein